MSAQRRRAVSGAVKNRTASRRRPTSNPPNRRVRLENDQRKAQLLALGRGAFADRSYDEVSIDDIATMAGISKGLLYHYFPTKRDLYLAGLRATAEELDAAMKQDDASLSTALTTYFAFAHSHVANYCALIQGGIGSDPEVGQIVASAHEKLRQLALPAAQQSNPTLTEDCVHLCLTGWLGSLIAVTLSWVKNPISDAATLQTWAESMLTACVHRTRQQAG